MSYDDLMNKFIILNKNYRVYQSRQDATNMYMLLKLLRGLHGNLLLKQHRLCQKINDKYERESTSDLQKYYQKLSMTDTFLETAKNLIKEHERGLKDLTYRPGPGDLVRTSDVFIPQNIDVKDIISSLDGQPYDMGKPFLVNFFAPWCTHCKRLMPIWESLRPSIQGYNIVKVDCVKYPNLCKRYGVQGYPTIKLFREGSVIDYSGNRTLEDFVRFLKQYDS
jgi:protein disulfide-isomerase-like protein